MHGALRQVPQSQQANGLTRSAADRGEYFDALAAATTTKKGVLEQLVKANSFLTTTNSELSVSVDSIIKANEQLSRRVGNCRNNLTRKDYSAPHPKTLCPHCKIEVMCAPDNCFDLEKRATRRPRVWKICLWWWGKSKIVDNKVNELSCFYLFALL